MMDNDLTPQILKRAYEIWENEGRPHGRDREHWFLAETQLSTVTESAIAEPGKPKRKPRLVSTSTRATKRR
jgi:hypothetical protein